MLHSTSINRNDNKHNIKCSIHYAQELLLVKSAQVQGLLWNKFKPTYFEIRIFHHQKPDNIKQTIKYIKYWLSNNRSTALFRLTWASQSVPETVEHLKSNFSSVLF